MNKTIAILIGAIFILSMGVAEAHSRGYVKDLQVNKLMVLGEARFEDTTMFNDGIELTYDTRIHTPQGWAYSGYCEHEEGEYWNGIRVTCGAEK